MMILFILLLFMVLGRQGIGAERSSDFFVTPLTMHQLTENDFSADKPDLIPLSETTRLIVQLTTPPLVEQWQTTRSDQQTPFVAEMWQEQAIQIAQEQEAFLTQLNGLSRQVVVDYRYNTLINAVVIEIGRDEAESISQLPHVQAVFPDQAVPLQLDSSINLIGTSTVWNQTGGESNAGKDVRIAIIDSGIELNNPMFSGNGFSYPAGYPKGVCTSQSRFCNGKIITARWYGINGAVPPNANNELPTPEDRNGHGSHVSGIATGRRVNANSGDGVSESVVGVAPAAYLMVYKACWNGPAGCPSSALLAALEDALRDGAHVVNASWGQGSNPHPNSSVFTSAIRNLVNAGVTVVAAAGNGEGIHCPACVTEVIAVGNTTTGRIHSNRIDVLGPAPVPPALTNIPSVLGIPSVLSADQSGLLRYSGAVAANNVRGCSAWPANSLNGAILLAERGDCTYEVKANHARLAGATAILVYNFQTSGLPQLVDTGNSTIPVLFLTRSDGLNLRDWVLANPTAQLYIESSKNRIEQTNWADYLNETSSIGPSANPDTLKPDLVAPGTAILSATDQATPGPWFAFNTGTSMAAPHVTGSAALLKQLHPTWTPMQIKTALTTTALPNVKLTEDGGLASHFAMGSGRLSLARLSLVGATFSHSSLHQVGCLVNCSWQVTLKNEGAMAATWSATIQADSDIGVTVSPMQLFVPPGGSAEFTVQINTLSMASSGWRFGTLVWNERDGRYSQARIPISIFADNPVTSYFQKLVSASHLTRNWGQPVTYTLRMQNEDVVTRTFTLTDTLPTNTAYISGSASPGLSYDGNTHTIRGAVAVPPRWQFQSAELPGYTTLSVQTLPFTCSGLCDDDWIESAILPFTFMGKQYEKLYINTNGFISFLPPDGTTNVPQQLPQRASPNAVIAPLWTDFDLRGGASDPKGNGQLYAGIVTLNAKRYTVIEWKDVEHWGNPSFRYSFQLWLEANTDRFWFAYGSLSSVTTYTTAVGAEREDGIIGAGSFFNGVGVLPSTQLETQWVNNRPTDLNFSVTVQNGTTFTNTATAHDGFRRFDASVFSVLGRGVQFLPMTVKQ